MNTNKNMRNQYKILAEKYTLVYENEQEQVTPLTTQSQDKLAGLIGLSVNMIRNGTTQFKDANPKAQAYMLDTVTIEDFGSRYNQDGKLVTPLKWVALTPAQKKIVTNKISISDLIRNGSVKWEKLTPEEQKIVKDEIGIVELVRHGFVSIYDISEEEVKKVAEAFNYNGWTMYKNNASQDEQKQYLLSTKKYDRIYKELALLYAGVRIPTLTIGKYVMTENLPLYTFDYKYAKDNKLLSTVTQRNLNDLNKTHGFKFNKVYITLLRGAPLYSYFITGISANNKPFIYARKETHNPLAGSSRIYSETKNDLASNFRSNPNIDRRINTLPAEIDL